MAQDKRTFMGGMNKDGDLRLIKNPDYIDGLNIRVASSVDGTIGSVENIEGNTKVTTPFYTTEQDIAFLQEGDYYEEVNAAAIFYQKVIRVYGWEEDGRGYRFKLYSDTSSGRDEILNLNWTGNSEFTATATALNQKFGEFGPLNNGIPIYHTGTGHQYTASVVLQTFNNYSILRGGYLEVVIQADHPGVDFNMSVESDYFPGDYFGSIDYQGLEPGELVDGIPITSNKNASISISTSFETGGFYNTDVTDDGFIISPDGALYEVGNRMLWRLRFTGNESQVATMTTDAGEISAQMDEGLENLTVFSYRTPDATYNLPIELENNMVEAMPFLEIGFNAFHFSEGNLFPFSVSKNSISQFLHYHFNDVAYAEYNPNNPGQPAAPKHVLANDLPLTFQLPAKNIVLAFEDGQMLSSVSSSNTENLDIMIVGPVGVRFNLALYNGPAAMPHEDSLITNSADLLQQADIFGSFGGVSVQLECVKNLSESTLQITDGIYDNFLALQQEIVDLNNHIDGLLGTISDLQGIIDQLTSDLAYTEGLLTTAEAEIDSLEITINEQSSMISSLEAENEQLNIDLSDLLISYNQLTSSWANILSQIEQINTNLLDALNPADPGTYIDDVVDLSLGTNEYIIDQMNDLLDVINEADQNYDDYIADLLEQLSDANVTINLQEEDIVQLQSDLDQMTLWYEVAVANEEAAVEEAQQWANALAEALNSLSENALSNNVIEAILTQLDTSFTSINNYFSSSVEAYDSIDYSLGDIYVEDFSFSIQIPYPVSGPSDYVYFDGWSIYTGATVASHDWNVITAWGPFAYGIGSIPINHNSLVYYMKNGYIKFPPFNFNHFMVNDDEADWMEENQYEFGIVQTGLMLPKYSFQSEAQWTPGTAIEVILVFEVVLPEGGEQAITDARDEVIAFSPGPDESFNFDSIDGNLTDPGYNYYYEERTIWEQGQGSIIGGGQIIGADLGGIKTVQFNFTIPEDYDTDSLFYNSLHILRVEGNPQIELRLTNISVRNDSALVPVVIDYDEAVVAQQEFLGLYSSVETAVIDFLNDPSELASLGEDNLSALIPGYGTEISYPNPFYGTTLWDLLNDFQTKVLSFTQQVQSNLYYLYDQYSTVLSVGLSGIINNQAEVELQLQQAQFELSESQSQVAELEGQLSFLQESGTASNWPAFLNPSSLTTLIHINGPEPGLGISAIGGSTDIYMDPLGVRIYPRYEMADGTPVSYQDTETVILPIITRAQYESLVNEVYSQTNNFIYYVTQNITNQAYTWNWSAQGSNALQEATVYLLNFSAEDHQLGSTNSNSPYPITLEGLDYTSDPFNLDSDDITAFSQVPALQFLIVYDNNRPGNIKYKTPDSSYSDVYLRGFEVTSGSQSGSIFASETNGLMQPSQWGNACTQVCVSAVLNTPEL